MGVAYTLYDDPPRQRRPILKIAALVTAVVLLFNYRTIASLVFASTVSAPSSGTQQSGPPPDGVRQCRLRTARAGPPPGFSERTESDRFVAGTRAVIVRNATVWTGERVLRHADIHMDRGIIMSVTSTKDKVAARDADVIQAHGAWVTPGLVDMHTHLGVHSMPELAANDDLNSRLSPTRPQLRSIDGFNEHDAALQLTAAGGVTSALVLPGSLDNIGGQAYPIKLGKRRTGPSARIIDPPSSLILPGEGNTARDDMYSEASGMRRPDESTAYRHFKMACGENARSYGLNRLDEAWNFRSAFGWASELIAYQDAYCDELEAGTATGPYPTDHYVEPLIDAMRGHVKIHTHCYTMTDIDTLVRHSNEFRFPIASLHHAHEAYLVPETVRATYNGTPVIAMFSTNANYKYESYFGSPFASEILRRQNITPVFKSDHPVTDSRHVLVHAAEAHHYGLEETAALRAVTSAPAEALGLAHRIGHVSKGHDADVVLWDRHPLQLGATARQVIVDGVPQLEDTGQSGASDTAAPKSADYDDEIRRVATSTDEIASLQTRAYPSVVARADSVVMHNVSSIYRRLRDRIVLDSFEDGVAVYARGISVCIGESMHCAHAIPQEAEHIDLGGGTITPGVIAYSSTATLGMADIPSERTASDGKLPSPPSETAIDPEKLGARIVPRAADGLSWGGHDLERAHASGVLTALSSPQYGGEFAGVSTHFDTGAAHVLEPYAVRKRDAALHVTLKHRSVPVSAQVHILRTVLSNAYAQLNSYVPHVDSAWLDVARGTIPLVVGAQSVAQMAQVILLQREFRNVRMVIDTAGPAHVLAADLEASGIGVLMPARKWRTSWDMRDSLPGAPLTTDTDLGVLLSHGVRVGVSIEEPWEASNLVWETTWALMDANTTSDSATVLELLTTKCVSADSIEALLGLPAGPPGDFVAYNGSPFTYGTKVVAAGTPRGIELFP